MEIGPHCSMHDLIREQASTSKRLLAISQEISARLGEHSTGDTVALGPMSQAASRSSKRQHMPISGPAPAGLAEPLLGAPPAGGGHGAVLSRENSFERHQGKSSNRDRNIFPDPEAVKEQVRQTIGEGSYNVENFYHTTGCWQALIRNNTFKNMTFLVIALNSLWIAVDTDYNKTDDLTKAQWEFQLAENLFCSFFALEITVRYKAFRNKRDAFRDGWFCFDLFLATLMVMSTWVMPMATILSGGGAGSSALLQNASIFRVLRLFRLARLGRLARLLKDIPELMVLSKGLVFAMRATFSTLCLLVLVIYVFAIIFTQTLAGTGAADGCFDTVLQSMNCLLLNGVFADQSSIVGQLLAVHWTYYVVVLVYLVIGSMTLLNMLIGVMCEVVQMVSDAEKETMMTQDLKDRIAAVLKDADQNDDQEITHEEFSLMLQSQDAMQALSDANIDVVKLVDVVDCIFQDKDSLDINDFVETVLTFRSDNTATVKDLIDSRRQIVAEIGAMMRQG